MGQKKLSISASALFKVVSEKNALDGKWMSEFSRPDVVLFFVLPIAFP